MTYLPLQLKVLEFGRLRIGEIHFILFDRCTVRRKNTHCHLLPLMLLVKYSRFVDLCINHFSPNGGPGPDFVSSELYRKTIKQYLEIF